MTIGRCPECNLPCSDLELEDPMPDVGCFRLRSKKSLGWPAGYCASNDVSWFHGRGVRSEGPKIEDLVRKGEN